MVLSMNYRGEASRIENSIFIIKTYEINKRHLVSPASWHTVPRKKNIHTSSGVTPFRTILVELGDYTLVPALVQEKDKACGIYNTTPFITR
jgi:hypothetical protein